MARRSNQKPHVRRSARSRPGSPRSFAGSRAPRSAIQLPNDVLERSLLTGENARLLEEYLGEADYDDFQRLAREAEKRSVRGGPRLLILPGIMGSKLGRADATLAKRAVTRVHTASELQELWAEHGAKNPWTREVKRLTGYTPGQSQRRAEPV